MKKSFERKYAIHVGSMKYGPREEQLSIDQEFFDHFEDSPAKDGDISVKLDMFRYETHIDVKFILEGNLQLNCDRCLEPYAFPIESEHRIIYSFDKELNFKGYEVMYADPYANYLSLVQELYDFISIAIPLRRVPDESIHQCDPQVTAFILTEESGGSTKEEEKEIDPRWEALKKLKDLED
jgi:uncharacterized metal-binding protein YceD (DUF177 family)